MTLGRPLRGAKTGPLPDVIEPSLATLAALLQRGAACMKSNTTAITSNGTSIKASISIRGAATVRRCLPPAVTRLFTVFFLLIRKGHRHADRRSGEADIGQGPAPNPIPARSNRELVSCARDVKLANTLFALCDDALIHHRAEQFAQAVSGYERILSLGLNLPQIYNNLGPYPDKSGTLL